MRYLITRKDETGLIATTTEIQEFNCLDDLEDFCWEISDKRYFSVTHVEIDENTVAMVNE